MLKQEAKFYRLTDLENSCTAAQSAASNGGGGGGGGGETTPIAPATVTGSIPAAAANTVVDDTADIWNKASRMQLEFQSVYVTVSSPNGPKFTEAERADAMGEVNERAAALQATGFRIKAMNSGVAQERKSKEYFMCASLAERVASACKALI